MSVRVAAVQLAAGTDVDANLATCLRMLENAAAERPDLVVLPEFCNHVSWYDGPHHCWKVAVDLDGPFVRAFADRVAALGVHAVINCTVRRDADAVTGTSMLFGPDGALLATTDKQVLIGHENDFLRKARSVGPVVDSPIGRLAMYACMDGVINETPRCLALRGAQILCNSLNSFAIDEASLHIPVRAPENRVFVVAANKVGPLIPEAMLEPISAATRIPVRFLYGAGESQIVGPDGTVLARAPATGEAVVIADIDPARADDKRRPDGTDVFAARRPALYGPIGADPERQTTPGALGAASVAVAIARPSLRGADAIAEAAEIVHEASRHGTRLVVLPELFFCDGGAVDAVTVAEHLSIAALSALSMACERHTSVVTSIAARADGAHRHIGVVIGSDGIGFSQHQLHACARHAWARPGDRVDVIDLPWGRLGIAVGDDSIYPETFRLLALAGAEVVAVPLRASEDWELSTGLVERSAENRMCVVAATADGGLITSLQRDFTLMTPWTDRAFDGLLSHPEVIRADPSALVTTADIAPQWAANKVVSHRTDLLRDRPWFLAGAITTPRTEELSK